MGAQEKGRPRYVAIKTAAIVLLSVCLVALAGMMILGLRGCRVEEYYAPFGLSIRNMDDQELLSASITLEPGGTFDFGRIPSWESGYRFIEIEGHKRATLNVKWADGRAQTLTFDMDVPNLSPVEIAVISQEIEQHLEDPEVWGPFDYWVNRPDPGDPEGIKFYWVGNDTAEPIKYAWDFEDSESEEDHKPGSSDPAFKWTLSDPECFATLDAYSMTGDLPPRPLVGQTTVEFAVVYANGRRFHVTADLDLKPRQRLVFIIKKDGHVVVWDDPLVEETSVAKSMQVNSVDGHRE